MRRICIYIAGTIVLQTGGFMNRLVPAAALMAVACSLSMAQHIEIGFHAGFGLGTGKGRVGADAEINNTGYTKYEDIYASGGNGLKLGGSATYYLKDNLGILVVGEISCFGGYRTRYSYQSSSDEFFISSNYAAVNLGVKLKTKAGRISPFIYLAPGLYLPVESGYWDYNSTGNPTETSDISIKYSPGFGFAAGMGALIYLSDETGFVAEIAPVYAFADQKEQSFTSDGYTTKTVYLNNTASLPAEEYTSDGHTVYYHGRPRRSFSSIAAKVGVFLTF
jgi:hypothetical protein